MRIYRKIIESIEIKTSDCTSSRPQTNVVVATNKQHTIFKCIAVLFDVWRNLFAKNKHSTQINKNIKVADKQMYVNTSNDTLPIARYCMGYSNIYICTLWDIVTFNNNFMIYSNTYLCNVRNIGIFCNSFMVYSDN